MFYGPSAWKEIVHIEVEMRKQQKDALYAAEERKELILSWVAGIFAFSVGAGALIGLVYVLTQM